MSTVVIAVIVLVIAGVVIAFLKNRPSGGKQNYPYRLTDCFMSNAELSFFDVLRRAVDDNGIVFAKVRIADVLATKRGLNNSQRQSSQNKINSKHFDFVICSPDTVKVLAAIELDDASHTRKDRITRDAFVNSAAEAAGLPLFRVPVKNAYPVAQLREKLTPYLDIDPKVETEGPRLDSEILAIFPACPKCGCSMVRRQDRTGALAGKEFWGCQQYPRCRGVLPISA